MRKIALIGTGNCGGNVSFSTKSHLFGTAGRDGTLDWSAKDVQEILHEYFHDHYWDTNRKTLNDRVAQHRIPKERTLVLGPSILKGNGSGMNPEKAALAYEESKAEAEAIMSQYDLIIPVNGGHKGTGLGTAVGIFTSARNSKKLALGAFIEPSPVHEVSIEQHDKAIKVIERLNATGCRYLHMDSRALYAPGTKVPAREGMHAMNLPFAQTISNLILQFLEGTTSDPNDMAYRLGGRGPVFLNQLDIDHIEEPTEEQINTYVQECMNNPYLSFNSLFGTGIVSVMAPEAWSNPVYGAIMAKVTEYAQTCEANIHRALKEKARKEDRQYETPEKSSFSPVLARYPVPKGWGINVFIASYDPEHTALEIELSDQTDESPAFNMPTYIPEEAAVPVVAELPAPAPPQGVPLALTPPNRGASAAPQTPAGAKPTASTPSTLTPPAINGQATKCPSEPMRLNAFITGINHGKDPALIELATKGKAEEAFTTTEVELRLIIGQPHFRDAFRNIFSDGMKNGFLNMAAQTVKLKDFHFGGWPKKHWRSLDYDKFQKEMVKASGKAVEDPDFRFVRTISDPKFWGEERARQNYELFRNASAPSEVPARTAPTASYQQAQA